MNTLYKQLTIILFLTSLESLAYESVIRLRNYEGDVSFRAAGSLVWAQALRNRPLIGGDLLWNDLRSQALLETPFIHTCMGENTLVKVLSVSDLLVQLQLNQGTLEFHIEDVPDQEYEISTPNLVLSLYSGGVYRIQVHPEQEITTVQVITGEGIIYGETGSYFIGEEESHSFIGTDLTEVGYPVFQNRQNERWCIKQLTRPVRISTQYLSPYVIGSQELDEGGSWVQLAEFGWAWTPHDVEDNWAPYREGHWVWIEPWGWSWIGAEPWGFAPYHYGRWYFQESRWYWIPGPKQYAPVYAPALVVFLSFGNGGIGWFPLAPGEVYWPSYYSSAQYFNEVNLSNTRINQAQLSAYYRNPTLEFRYQYQANEQAITATRTTDFARAQFSPMNRNELRREFRNPRISQIAQIVPQEMSITGPSNKGHVPPASILSNRALVLKPIPKQIPYKDKANLLSRDPGRTISPEALKSLENKQIESDTVIRIKPSKPQQDIGKRSQHGGAGRSPEMEQRGMNRERALLERQKRRLERQQQEINRQRLEQQNRVIRDQSRPPTQSERFNEEAAPRSIRRPGLEEPTQRQRRQGDVQRETEKAVPEQQRTTDEKVRQKQPVQESAQQQQKAAEELTQQQKNTEETTQQRPAEKALRQQQKALEETAKQQSAVEKAARQQKAAEEAAQQQRAVEEAARQQQKAAEEAAQQQRAVEEAARQQQKAAEEAAQQQRAAEEAARQQQKAAEEAAQQQRAVEEAARQQQKAAEEAVQQQRAAEEAARQQQKAAEEAAQKQKAIDEVVPQAQEHLKSNKDKNSKEE